MQNHVEQVRSEVVDNALRDLLESSGFRSSNQCRLLLRYIVDHTLSGQQDLLRERVIGASVFGRAPDYDTGNDPVVRARVAEVRKRLAQYYLDHRSESPVTISIPSGSYRAAFLFESRAVSAKPGDKKNHVVEKSPDPLFASDLSPLTSTTDRNEKRRASLHFANGHRVGIAMSILSVAAICGLFVWIGPNHKQQEDERLYQQFWAPLGHSNKPVVIYIGANYSYRLSARYLEDYCALHHLPYTGPEFFIDMKAMENIPESALVPNKSLIGFGDVAATGHVIATLGSLGKKYDLRYGDDIAITDFRSSPAILIGGFSNPWGLRLTHDLRYTLEHGDRIVDHLNKSKSWQRNKNDPGESQNDYVVLSRLVHSQTGDFALVIAGVDTGANQAAADFISNPEQVNKLLKTAPSSWQHMNMQVVLHTTMMNGVPTSTDLQAVYFW